MNPAQFPSQRTKGIRIEGNWLLNGWSSQSLVTHYDLTLWAFRYHFVGIRYIGIGIEQTVPEIILIQPRDKGVL